MRTNPKAQYLWIVLIGMACLPVLLSQVSMLPEMRTSATSSPGNQLPAPSSIRWGDAVITQHSCDIHSPHPYPENYDHAWAINHPGAMAIRVQFSNFSTEAAYWYWHDYVLIYDAGGYYEDEHAGSLGTFWSGWVEGSGLTVHLYSDEINNYYGFDAVIYEVAVYNDSDADGLPNWQEVEIYGTNPLAADSDGDRLSDSEEVLVYRTNAANPDTDSDDLQDGEEIGRYGTNATNPNTDGDWFGDGLEVHVLWSDPNSFYDPGGLYALLAVCIIMAPSLVQYARAESRRVALIKSRRGAKRPKLLSQRESTPPASQLLSQQREAERQQENLVRRIADCESRLIWIKHLPAYAEYVRLVEQILAGMTALATSGKIPAEERPAKSRVILQLCERETQLHQEPAIHRAITRVRDLESTLQACKALLEEAQITPLQN